MITFYLPFPPSVNKLYPTVDKKRIKSQEYKEWIKAANSACNRQIIPPMLERCVIVYKLQHPDDRDRDAENYAKAATDFLVSRGIIQDDNRQFLQGTFSIWTDEPGGLVEVNIYSADEFPLDII